MEKVTGREKIFYEDQKGKLECHLSEEIDEEFEQEKERALEKNQQKKEQADEFQYDLETSFVFDEAFHEEVKWTLKCKQRNPLDINIDHQITYKTRQHKFLFLTCQRFK